MRRRLLVLLALPLLVLAAEDDPLDPTRAPMPVRRAVFRAETVRQRGDLEEARRILADALAAGESRDHPALRYRLGAYLLELDRPAEALPHLRAAGRQAPQAAIVWRDLARAAYETGGHAEAAAAFARAYRCQTAAAEPPPDRELLHYSGVAWIMADRPDSALNVLAPLVADVPDTVPSDWVRALVSAAAAADQPARAADGVTRLLHDHPDDPGSWRLASQLAQLAGDVRLAAVRLQVAAWLTDPSADETRHLAELYAAAGAPRKAARLYARLWDEGRGSGSLVEPLAATWLHAHEPDSARVVLAGAVAAAPSARLFMLLGDLEYEVERWDAAVAAYERAVALEPGRGRGWLMLGACEARRGRNDAASRYLLRAGEDPAVRAQAERLLAQVSGR